jgi:hypothetical protein
MDAGACRAQVVVLHDGAEVGRWALVELRCPDLSAVDDLARLQLAARRLGCTLRVEDACAELRGLLDLVGLDSVVPCEPPPQP